MKIASCIASLEHFIEETASQRPLVAGEQIAQWTNGDPIYIRGKWRSKGYFRQLCVRWESPQQAGMFRKGLAGYFGGGIEAEKIDHLPFVK